MRVKLFKFVIFLNIYIYFLTLPQTVSMTMKGAKTLTMQTPRQQLSRDMSILWFRTATMKKLIWGKKKNIQALQRTPSA